jgi:hypothetical protein
MRTATFIIALLGGILGILMGFIAMAVGGIASAFGSSEGGSIAGLGISAIAASMLGIVCGSLYYARKATLLMGFGLLISAVWHFISISAFAVPGGTLLIIATLLAFMGRGKASAPKPPENAPAV